MIVTSTTTAVVALRALGPIPILVAQVGIALVESGVTLVFVLGFAISGLKLLFLTHFDQVFQLEPAQLAHKIFIVSLAVAIVPNMMICVYLAVSGSNDAKFIQVASGNLGSIQSIHSFYTLYVVFWTILSLAMIIISVSYVSYFVKTSQRNNSAIRAAEKNTGRKSPDLKKFLLGSATSLGFVTARQMYIISWGEHSIHLFPFFLPTIVPSIWLVVYALDEDIGNYFCKVLTKKLSSVKIRIWRSHQVAPLPPL